MFYVKRKIAQLQRRADNKRRSVKTRQADLTRAQARHVYDKKRMLKNAKASALATAKRLQTNVTEMLPKRWSVSYTDTGSPYYVNHTLRTTSWNPPSELDVDAEWGKEFEKWTIDNNAHTAAEKAAKAKKTRKNTERRRQQRAARETKKAERAAAKAARSAARAAAKAQANERARLQRNAANTLAAVTPEYFENDPFYGENVPGATSPVADPEALIFHAPPTGNISPVATPEELPAPPTTTPTPRRRPRRRRTLPPIPKGGSRKKYRSKKRRVSRKRTIKRKRRRITRKRR